ncbi:hypothetical protein SOVF_186920 [Spinacia oleracea]|nr:hypothetical protein SOVF_186920 [Spinacia oleracea]
MGRAFDENHCLSSELGTPTDWCFIVIIMHGMLWFRNSGIGSSGEGSKSVFF